MPRSCTMGRAVASVWRRSSIASPVSSQMPVTNSTVLRNSSWCTRGFSPSSDSTALASLLRSRVAASTRANSHSTPRVGRAQWANSIRACALEEAVLSVRLSGADDTTRNPFAGVSGGQRGLVRAGSAMDLCGAVRREVGEVVVVGVDDDGGLLAGQQLILG